MILIGLLVLAGCSVPSVGPYCGKVDVLCFTAPCDPVYETFYSLEDAEKSSAYDIENRVCITSFDDCIAAGNPAMESYPRQCIADGRTFVEIVS